MMQDDWFECFQTNEMKSKITHEIMTLVKKDSICLLILSYLQDDEGRKTLHEFIENKQIIVSPDNRQIMLRYSRSQPELCVVQAKQKTLFLGTEYELWKMICGETNSINQKHNKELIALLKLSIINHIEYCTRIQNLFMSRCYGKK
jgi:hypothetical protein